MEKIIRAQSVTRIQAYTGCKAGAAIHLLKRIPIQGVLVAVV